MPNEICDFKRVSIKDLAVCLEKENGEKITLDHLTDIELHIDNPHAAVLDVKQRFVIDPKTLDLSAALI